ncbi:putative small heat shock protein HSP20 [Helianthus annuus]|uniref:Small heat shock protein HSP20 n=1 Tax=Helianthus annuus TaxID=4232 RepID=A0A9K3H9M1_HELAN|nr:putative small heat shock protein HSP20 [Helianthus annuus]KAJ0842183.1 17.8 kDa class I heat shock protein [Helianthus annuus]
MSIIPSFFTGSRSNIFDPFSSEIWDPFQGFSSVLSNLPESSRETTAIANTRIDWKETPEAHVFKADLPGLKKEEVKVEVEEGRVLQISGERSRENEEKNDKWHRVERSSGKFLRRFRLPENAKMDQVKAAMENGVLTVTVPKEEEKKPEVEVEEGRVLQISGERSRENVEKNDKWHRMERSSGKFLRRFRLPENAKMDQVKAAMENGVLTVTVPKAEVKKPEVKAIDIS